MQWRWFSEGRITESGQAALSATLAALCFFPSSWWNPFRAGLGWLALAPFFVALDVPRVGSRSFPGRAAGIGYTFGLMLHLIGAYWLTNIVSDWPLALLPYISVAVIEAAWFALFAVVFSLWRSKIPIVWQPYGFAALWVFFEWLRTQGDYAFPWFPLAATQAPAPAILQVCSVTGQWGLSFAVALTGALAGQAFQARPICWRMALPIAAIPVALGIGGSLVLHNEAKVGPTAIVGVAQASYNGSDPEESLRMYLRLAGDAVHDSGRPLDLLVCPESTYWEELQANPYALSLTRETARALQTALLIGTDDSEGNGRQRRRYNAAALVSSEGTITGVFHKIKIVPLGEFFPLREVLGSIYSQFPTGNNDLTPGTLPGALAADTKGARTVGTLICYESAFGWRARQEALAGANLLAVITNDAWFGNSAGPLQHADLSCLRAVETGCPVARAATSGESRLIDPQGRVLAIIPLLQRGTAQTALPLRTDKTLYDRFGDWFVGCCFVFLVGLIVRYRQ